MTEVSAMDVATDSAPGDASEGSEILEAAPDGEVETPAGVEKHKLTIDGEEVEVDLDELRKGYQLAKASGKRFEEASRIQKQLNELLFAAKENPDAFLKHLGLDPTEYAEKTLLARLEEETMTPEQKEIRELKRKAELFDKQVKERDESERTKAEQAAVEKAAAEVDAEIMTAFQKAGLKPSLLGISDTAVYMSSGLTADEAVAKVKNHHNTFMNDHLQNLDAETLLSVLPKEVLQKIRQADVARTKKLAKPPVVFAAPEKAKSPDKKMNIDEYFDSLVS